MIVQLDKCDPGITFGKDRIVTTHDIKLSLDGMNIGRYVTSASIELDAQKGLPEIHLKLIPTGFPHEIDGKVYLVFEDHTFECTKVHKNVKVS